jgi:LysR family transcriptional regulator, cyn operon transcriptional activator
MNLQQLRYLVATADNGTMTAAAAQLHVAQPALSRAMKALEAELQVQIFERAGRSVRLTDTGVEIVAAARVALDDIDQVFAVARLHAADPETLVVVTTPTLEPLFARHFLPEYYARYPGSSARVRRASGREEVVSAVLAGEAMLGLCDLPLPDELVVVPVGHFEVVLLSPPGSLLPEQITWGALDGIPLILPSIGTTRRTEFNAFFDMLEIRPVVALESDERGSWLEGVLAGIGSVLWYGERATNAIERGAQLAHFTPPLRRSIGLTHLPDHLEPEAEAFLGLAGEIGLPSWAYTSPL